MPEVTLARRPAPASRSRQLAKQAGVVESTSEALRLIAQRGLKVDGDVVADKGARRSPRARTVVVQAGKRKFARVADLSRRPAEGRTRFPFIRFSRNAASELGTLVLS